MKRISLFVDINECSTGSHSCGLNAACINLPGTYDCPCKPGFTMTSPHHVCKGKYNYMIMNSAVIIDVNGR